MRIREYRSRCAVLLAVAGALLLAGCGTTLGRRNSHGVLYPATSYDGAGLAIALTCPSVLWERTDPPFLEDAATRVGMIVACLADLPVSLVTDTLLLPHDVAESHRLGLGQRLPGGESAASPSVVRPRPEGAIREGGKLVGVVVDGRRYRAMEHTITEGESSTDIARMYGVPESLVLSANGLPGTGVLLQVGDTVVVPFGGSTPGRATGK